jgi:hypothetical protein
LDAQLRAMDNMPPISTLSADQLMARAMKYRRMAQLANTIEAQEALIKLAIRFVSRATQRKLEERQTQR